MTNMMFLLLKEKLLKLNFIISFVLAEQYQQHGIPFNPYIYALLSSVNLEVSH